MRRVHAAKDDVAVHAAALPRLQRLQRLHQGLGHAWLSHLYQAVLQALLSASPCSPWSWRRSLTGLSGLLPPPLFAQIACLLTTGRLPHLHRLQRLQRVLPPLFACGVHTSSSIPRRQVHRIGALLAYAATEALPGVLGVLGGSYRRGYSHSRSVSLVLSLPRHSNTSSPASLLRNLLQWTRQQCLFVARQRHCGSDRLDLTIRHRQRLCRVRVFAYEAGSGASLGLLHATGSREFVRRLAWRAHRLNMLLSHEKLVRFDPDTLGTQEIHCPTERHVFVALQIDYIEPQQREAYPITSWLPRPSALPMLRRANRSPRPFRRLPQRCTIKSRLCRN